MGGRPWHHFVPFESSVESALEKLRQRVFETGNYRGSEGKPATIDEALQNMEADGTASILDMIGVSDEPDFCVAAPLSADYLQELYGTARPTRQMVESDMNFFEEIQRGQGVYFVVFDGDAPSEYCFAGYSFD